MDDIKWKCPTCVSYNVSQAGTVIFICQGCGISVSTEQVQAQQPAHITL